MAALNLVIPISTPETDAALAAILTKLESIMSTLEDLKANVAAERTVVNSAIALLGGLSEKIAALKPDQDSIDQLAKEVLAQRTPNRKPSATPTNRKRIRVF